MAGIFYWIVNTAYFLFLVAIFCCGMYLNYLESVWSSQGLLLCFVMGIESSLYSRTNLTPTTMAVSFEDSNSLCITRSFYSDWCEHNYFQSCVNSGNCSAYSFTIVLCSFLSHVYKPVLSQRLQGGLSVDGTVEYVLSLPSSLYAAPFSLALCATNSGHLAPVALIWVSSTKWALFGLTAFVLQPGNCLQAIS